MTSAHIEIGTTRHGAELRNFVDRLQALVDDARSIKAGYDQTASGGDYAALATLLGLPEVVIDPETNAEPDAATAQEIYNPIGSVAARLTETEVFYNDQGQPVPATFIGQLLSRMT